MKYVKIEIWKKINRYAQKQDNVMLVISGAGEMIVLQLFFSEFQIVLQCEYVSFYPKRFFPNLKIVTHF